MPRGRPRCPTTRSAPAYDAHGAELYRFARRSLGDAGLAEDAVQETFLRAWRASASYDPARPRSAPGCSPSCATWSSTWRRARRAARRWPRPTRGRRRAAADDELEQALTAWQVEAALAELDDDHRRVLVEVHWRGRPYARGRRRPRHPGPGTVKSRVYYGLRAMRTASRPRGGEMAEHPLALRGMAAGPGRLAGGAARRPSEEARCRAPRDCAACRAEADSLLARRRRDRSAPTPARPWPSAEPPPADLGDRIVARVAASERRAAPARRGDGAWPAAAAAVVAVVAVIADATASRRCAASRSSFVRQARGRRRVGGRSPRTSDGSLVELTATGLDPDVTYSLWLTPPGGG